MHFDSLDSILGSGRSVLAKGPIAILFAEDAIEVDTTIRHHLDAGFLRIIVLASPSLDIGVTPGERVIRVNFDALAENAVPMAMNRLIDACDGQWLYYCYNAEYLF